MRHTGGPKFGGRERRKGLQLRILITGMGGELGTRVANLLEARPEVEAITGVDIDPPRRRLARAQFHRVDPRDRARTAEIVRAFGPTALVHIGTYEPNARSSPTSAMERTASGTIGVMTAVAESPGLDRIVVRSGIEVYGRRSGAPIRPDEFVAPDPTTPWGSSLLFAERMAEEAGVAAGAVVTPLRFAPLVGPHFPSPLGRFLRLPVVPVSATSDPSFSVLHQEDAAGALVAAVLNPFAGPVNVVGPGAITAIQAARMGHRIPLPVVGPGWRAARGLAAFAGAPVPAHIHELLVRGRIADGSLARTRIDFTPQNRTRSVVRHLYDWAEVTYLTGPADHEAA